MKSTRTAVERLFVDGRRVRGRITRAARREEVEEPGVAFGFFVRLRLVEQRSHVTLSTRPSLVYNPDVMGVICWGGGGHGFLPSDSRCV